MSNPVFNENSFNAARAQALTPNSVMTLQGTINKSFFLFFIVLICGMVSFKNPAMWSAFLWPSLIGATIVAFIIIFKKNTAPYLSWLYAALEGLVLGSISYAFEAQYAGIVASAIMASVAVFVGMLIIYKLQIIKVTQGFIKLIMSAMFGIIILYLTAFVAGLFGVNLSFLYSSTWGVAISLFICAIAAFNFLIDFEFINKASASGSAPKYMEWYAAFGLMLTFVWLYLEILSLLGKRRN